MRRAGARAALLLDGADLPDSSLYPWSQKKFRAIEKHGSSQSAASSGVRSEYSSSRKSEHRNTLIQMR